MKMKLIEVLNREVGPYILYIYNNLCIAVSVRGPEINGNWVSMKEMDTLNLMRDDLGEIKVTEYDNPVTLLLDAAHILHKRDIYDMDPVQYLLDKEPRAIAKDSEHWIQQLHDEFVHEVTDTEVPLWIAQAYGELAWQEAPDNPLV